MPTYRHRGEPCVSRDASGSILNPYLEAIILLNLAPTVGLRDRNGYLLTDYEEESEAGIEESLSGFFASVQKNAVVLNPRTVVTREPVAEANLRRR